MIRVRTETRPRRCTRLLVSSNLSITLDRLALFFLVLSAVTLLVALWPTLMGFWPVMLIAVIHLAIVGWCLRLAWRGNWYREYIEIRDDAVVIEHFRLGHILRAEMPTAWVRVLGENGDDGELHVHLCDRGRCIEVGAFLPLPERIELAQALKNGLKPHSAWSN